MISVIIASKNRPNEMLLCLQSMLHDSFETKEILVVDQSAGDTTEALIRSIKNKHIVYLRHQKGGKSTALNTGIAHARGNIIAFTDDDCIIDNGWLESLHKTFKENRQVGGVFGRTMPYQPNKNKGKMCPCTFEKTQKKLITKSCYHADHIGFGNNMAFRKEVFTQIGGFKNWLGPGSVGSNAEDAEFTLRALLKGYKLLYDPSVIVYHNKWLTGKQMKKQELSYTCGELACYGYFLFQGNQFSKPIVLNNLKYSWRTVQKIVKKIIILKWNKSLPSDCIYWLTKNIYAARGLIVGFIYSL